MDNTQGMGEAMERANLRDRVAKLEADGKATTEKTVEAVTAVKQALYDTLGHMPMALAVGVLEIVKADMIEDGRGE